MFNITNSIPRPFCHNPPSFLLMLELDSRGVDMEDGSGCLFSLIERVFLNSDSARNFFQPENEPLPFRK